MPKYQVDVKAFVVVDVEAANPAAARALADDWVEAMPDGVSYVGPIKSATASVDGTSEVERLCEECGETTDNNDAVHDWCVEEPEPPLDTPSLDTSFHDNEMDVG